MAAEAVPSHRRSRCSGDKSMLQRPLCVLTWFLGRANGDNHRDGMVRNVMETFPCPEMHASAARPKEG
jgi:hypothetical protein